MKRCYVKNFPLIICARLLDLHNIFKTLILSHTSVKTFLKRALYSLVLKELLLNILYLIIVHFSITTLNDNSNERNKC